MDANTEGITIKKKQNGKYTQDTGSPAPRVQAMEDFDMDALDALTSEIEAENRQQAAQQQARKAGNDALVDAILAEEHEKMEQEARQQAGPAQPPKAKNAPKSAPKSAPKPNQGSKQKQPNGSKASKPKTGTPQAQQKPAPQKDAMAQKKAKKQKPSGKKIGIIVGSVVLALAVIVGLLFLLDGGKIADNVFVAGVDVGGMSKTEAVKAVREATDSLYASDTLTVAMQDAELTISPEVSGAALDADGAVDAAYRHTRLFGVLRLPGSGSGERYDVNLNSYLTLNKEAIAAAVKEKAGEVDTELVQTKVTFEEQKINQAAEDDEEEEETDSWYSEPDDPYGEADDMEQTTTKVMTITMGTSQRTIDPDALFKTVLQAYNTASFDSVTYDYELVEPDKLDLQKIYDENCTPAVDASFDKETRELVEDQVGYGFDLEKVQKKVDAAKEGDVITVEFKKLKPKVTLKDLEDVLFHDTLASYSSPHTAIYNRTVNLELACEAIDGTIINDGEIFSFNDVVGERTSAKGYLPAAIYSDGKTVDSLGGGVCQVASTIYMCALLADLDNVERECHMFQVSYVPLGMDATVYFGSLDYKFKNNTGYPLRVDASVYGGYVNISIVGTETKDYTIQMTYEVTGATADGTSVVTYKHKIDANGNEISVEKEASSYYRNHTSDDDDEEIENPVEDDETGGNEGGGTEGGGTEGGGTEGGGTEGGGTEGGGTEGGGTEGGGTEGGGTEGGGTEGGGTEGGGTEGGGDIPNPTPDPSGGGAG